MATAEGQTHGNPVLIAPKPAKGADTIEPGPFGKSSQPAMPYTCQACAKRKVKCDKASPVCSSCRKSKLECCYQTPPPRSRKRKYSDGVLERLSRYERILREHGLLEADISHSVEETSPQEPISLRWSDPDNSRTGKLLAGQGKSRYIDGELWRNLEDDGMQRVSDDEEEEEEEEVQVLAGAAEKYRTDPLTGAFVGFQQSLLYLHPTHAEALTLWKTHAENVEPLIKILHIPSTLQMIDKASQQPAIVSKANECLLFAIYHYAVFSMKEDECAEKLSLPRAILLERYHFATRQALVNASFLKTSDISILQALVLFLIPCRHFYDPHTYWILTGVAVRIAQRIGLHRDGETLGLPPFEVQMRRRLFNQLMPLDGTASQMTGTGMSVVPHDWNTRQPLNLNDAQIWPGMTETPQEHKGATEMIFCLSRSCIGRFLVRAGKPASSTGSWQFQNYQEAELAINEIESEVEEKYIRYCDVVNPLHFLTIAMVRSGITAMRFRTRLSKIQNKTATEVHRRELLQLSQKTLDTDTATYTHAGLEKYRWYMGRFFLWGTWDSLIFVLDSLWRNSSLFSPSEIDAAWKRVEQLYQNHDELLEAKQALHVAVGRLALKAWDACPPSSSSGPELAFIVTLRSLRKGKSQNRKTGQEGSAESHDWKSNIATASIDPSPTGDMAALSDSLPSSMGLALGDDLNLDAADWMFWDQLIHDVQTQGNRQ